MSAKKAKPKFSTVQPDLFQRLETPVLEDREDVDLDLGPELLGALNQALREAKRQGISRERLVDRMNTLMPDLERPITKRQLDSWMARSKEHHEFPMRYIAAFCVATKSELPLRVIANALGFDLVDSRERMTLELGEIMVRKGRISQQERALKRYLENE